MSDTSIQGSITVDKFSHLPIDLQQTVRSLERENAALRELVNESYQFFRFGHEDLEFWKKGIDSWCKRAERLGFEKEAQP